MVFLTLGIPDEGHRYLQASTHYYGTSPDLTAANFPPNNTTAGLAEGLAEAHKAYDVAGYAFTHCASCFAHFSQFLYSFRCSSRRA